MNAPEPTNALIFLAILVGLSLGYLWHEVRRAPVIEPDVLDLADDLRGDFDWPDGYPKCGNELAADISQRFLDELLDDIEKEVGIA